MIDFWKLIKSELCLLIMNNKLDLDFNFKNKRP